MHATIGIDVGNFNVKSQNTSTPSGFEKYAIEPQLAKSYLYYNNVYYVPSVSDRIEYVQDKTENDLCLILTLIGIAKELVFQAKNKIVGAGREYNSLNLQAEIDKISSISLGLGLPVGDLETLKTKTEDYYREKLKNGVSFEFSGYKFSFEVKKIKVYPQGLLPVIANDNCKIPQEYSKFAIVDIGGQTVDVIPVAGGNPDVGKCFSDRRGVRALFTACVSMIEREFQQTVGEDTINDVLHGKKTLLSDEMIKMIHEQAQLHTDKILNYAQMNRSIKFVDTPVVFFGGGALLLKPYIEKYQGLKLFEFVEDVNGNARFYARYIDNN